MSKKFFYSLRGWRERSLDGQWQPAGNFAALVLAWPDIPPRAEPWASRWKGIAAPVWRRLVKRAKGSDGDRLREIERALGPDEDRLREGIAAAVGRRWLAKARSVAGRTELIQEVQAAHRSAGLPVMNGALIERGPVGVQYYDRDGDHSLVTPAEAVYLSAVTGVARGTLRLCETCARFVAFPRVGFSQKHCQECSEIRRARPLRARESRNAPPLPPHKRERWERVYARVYMRLLTESRRQASRKGGERRLRAHLTLLSRGKRSLLPKRRGPQARAMERWRLPAWNALLVATDLDAWEAKWAPKQKRGPKLRKGG